MLTPSSIVEPSREAPAENASWGEEEPLIELPWLLGVDVATVGDTRLEVNIGWANLRASDRAVNGVEVVEDGFEPVRERNRLSFLDLISEAGRGMFCGATVSGRGWLRSDGVSDASKPGELLGVLVRNANGAAMWLVSASTLYDSARGSHTLRRTGRNVPRSRSICGNFEVSRRIHGAVVVV